MNLAYMIDRLITEGGFSEYSLAQSIGSSQPTINRAKKGVGTSYKTGKNIEELYYKTFELEENQLTATQE